MASKEDLEQAIDLIKKSNRIVALTGAGISVDSGIPDFRSEGGLWERYDPHEYATYDSFLINPEKFWQMGQELAEVILKAARNSKNLANLSESSRRTSTTCISQQEARKS
jgi:NAD-dependent deacetylase